MAEVIFVVSRTAPQTYMYLRHAFADESTQVVRDRRMGERRRSQTDRLHADRRRRDVTGELQSTGRAVVRRVGNPMNPDASCVEPGCHEDGVVGLNGAWLCLTHFDIRFAAMQAALGRASPRAS